MNNSKLFIILVLCTLGLAGCMQEDAKNIYTISGKANNVILVSFLPNNEILFDTLLFAVNLISEDHVIATDDDGTFTFTGLEEGKSYTIIPEQIGTDGSGMSALDLVMVRKYTEGTQVLDAFQKLAADVNRDNLIDSTDLELISNCILDTNKCFDYRFATDDYDGNGIGQADQYVIHNLMSDITINLLPIFTGDITGTHVPH